MNQQAESEVGKKPVHHSGSLFWPILLISIGFLLLANNFELLPWTIWQKLLDFWPVILILVGLEILLGRNKTSNLIVTLVGIIILLSILISTIPELSLLINHLLNQTNSFIKH